MKPPSAASSLKRELLVSSAHVERANMFHPRRPGEIILQGIRVGDVNLPFRGGLSPTKVLGIATRPTRDRRKILVRSG